MMVITSLTKTTNARRVRITRESLVEDLRKLVRAADANAWAIGDMVNRLKTEQRMQVKDVARLVGASRQRLSELRRTAAAFPHDSRRLDRDIHFHTVAARAARRLDLSPVVVLDEIIEQRIDSIRKATRYLAERMRACEAAIASAESGKAKAGRGINRCHHTDFRDVLQMLAKGSVKLILADAPYGTYGRYRDGQHTRVTAAGRDCDSLADADVRQVVLDLLRSSSSRVAEGGCLVLFRPGGLHDPPWILDAAKSHGWTCRHAVTWQRGSPKLGDGKSPYAPGTERLLVFALGNEPLINHDSSPRADVISIPSTNKSYSKLDQHLFEKPVELMRMLVAKHSYPGELVVEPFGATGPGSLAAAELKRKWVYIESNAQNYQLGSTRLAEKLTKLTTPAK
jgi:hypothetical protein